MDEVNRRGCLVGLAVTLGYLALVVAAATLLIMWKTG